MIGTPHYREWGRRNAIVHARQRPGSTVPHAFVLGLNENGYGVVRSLASEGLPVLGFHSGHAEFGRYSRHCATHFLPPGLDDVSICRELIRKAALCECKPVLIPTSDYYANLLALHSRVLRRHFLFHWIEACCLDDIVDKTRMSRICQEAGVPAPVTRATVAGEDAATVALDLSYPCLIKPNRSFRTPFPAGLKNFVASTSEQLIGFYRAHPELLGATLCQQIIEGGDEDIFQCTVLVREDGRPAGIFCTRKLHQYPPGYGVMSFGRSEDNPDVRALAMRLLGHLQYRGLASLEFKYCAGDGGYYFIEMNPRLPWYNALFTSAGVNLAHLSYLDLTGQACPLPTQRNGVHWLSFKLDFGWFLRARQSRGQPFVAWLLSLLRANCHAWFVADDPRPFVHATINLVGIGLQRLFRMRDLGSHVNPMRSAGR